MRYILAILLFLACISPQAALGQELTFETREIWKAKVVNVIREGQEYNPAVRETVLIQTLEARILEGEKEGEVVELRNDYVSLDPGDVFYISYVQSVDGFETYSVREVQRSGTLLLFLLLFVGIIILFGGKQGVRSLLALFGSLFIVIYLLLPSLARGYPPVLMSILIATAILGFAIFLTHGWNRRSGVAFVGTVTAVVLTGVLAYIAVSLTKLSGFTSDESLYLSSVTETSIDIVGLLLGGIIIGALGVLDDIAITQVSVVSELYHLNPSLSVKDAYKRAIRVGREHVGALVNTLALAYTGASLPLLLLFSASAVPFGLIINSEVFVAEIIRVLAGSIGLVLAVPFTTFLATVYLRGKKNNDGFHGHSH